MTNKTNLCICPKCGEWMCKKPDSICYCGSRVVETDVDHDICFLLFLNGENEQLNAILQILYCNYVYNSPTFDKTAYENRLKEEEEDEKRWQKMYEEIDRKIEDRNNPKCPNCRSTAITAGQRGFSIITGFWGSGNTVNRCAACGHKWKP